MGSGNGAFTLALREVVGDQAQIYAIDRDASALRDLERSMTSRFPATALTTILVDMTSVTDIGPLDGIVAANSLHYLPRALQNATLRHWRTLLDPTGAIIVVEYGTDVGNRWVPHPFSFQRLDRMAQETGFDPPTLLHQVRSRFLGSIYAASLKPHCEEQPGSCLT